MSIGCSNSLLPVNNLGNLVIAPLSAGQFYSLSEYCSSIPDVSTPFEDQQCITFYVDIKKGNDSNLGNDPRFPAADIETVIERTNTLLNSPEVEAIPKAIIIRVVAGDEPDIPVTVDSQAIKADIYFFVENGNVFFL